MQTVTDRFHQLAQGSVVPLSWQAMMSFTKQRNENVSWFILDQSVLNGSDVLATLDNNPTQVWDAYDWASISDRLMEMSVERSVEFPYNVQSSIADITLNNFDGYFSPDGLSPIAQYILPKRPIRLFSGFKTETDVPVFVGMTQGMPNFSDDNTQLSWTAMDFLSEIADEGLRNAITLRNVTTDKVIAVILQQYGMTPDQYHLDIGQNEIPFVMFEKGANAGNALKKLVQAENGALWLDEQGIIRFTTRSGVLGKMPVMIFNDGNIISLKPSRADNIINRVRIESEVRAVQDLQPMFTMTNERGFESPATEDSWRVPANGTLENWLTLDDPAWSSNDLVFNGDSDDSWFSALSLSGERISTGVNVSGTLFQNAYKVVITNTNSAPVSIDALELWGEPARVVETIEYEAYESDSRERFGDMALEITDNNFFGSYRNSVLLAKDVLDKQSDYSSSIEMIVKGDPSLQMGDVISVEGKFAGDYLVKAISVKLSKGLLETTIRAVAHEVVTPFILDQSILNGPDVLG